MRVQLGGWRCSSLFFTVLFFCSNAAAQEHAGELVPDPSIKVEQNESEPSLWSFSGYLKNETAYRYREPRTITKIRNIVYLNAQYPLSDASSFNFSGWAYHDLAYDLFNYETIAARLERDSKESIVFIKNLDQEKDSPVAEVRELYIDVAGDDYDIRVGKQYVIWGVLEGVRIVDEVNPFDFRELILPDLLDYRVPLWTAKLNYYGEWGDTELILIPELKFHQPAPPGSEWELLQEVPGTRSPDSYRLENIEIGLKFDTTVLDTELSFSYFYTWDDFPVVFRTVRIDGTDDPVFFPTFTRISMYGMTGVKQLGPFILKGEGVYVEDKFFGLSNTADNDADGFVDLSGELQKNHIRWGAGIEFLLFGWDTSLGMTQWIVLDYDERLLQAEEDTSYNIFLRKEFPQYSLTVQVLYLYLQTLDEIYIKPKAFFQITNNFQVAVGLDLFDGSPSDFGTTGLLDQSQFSVSLERAQFVGNFSDNDRIFFDFKYSF